MISKQVKLQVQPATQLVSNSIQHITNIQNKLVQGFSSNEQEVSRIPNQNIQVQQQPQGAQNTIPQTIVQAQKENDANQQKEQVTFIQPLINEQPINRVQINQQKVFESSFQQNHPPIAQLNNIQVNTSQIRQEVLMIQNNNIEVIKPASPVMESIISTQSKPILRQQQSNVNMEKPISEIEVAKQQQILLENKQAKQIAQNTPLPQKSAQNLMSKEDQHIQNSQKNEEINVAIEADSNQPETLKGEKIQVNRENETEHQSKYRLNSEYVQSIQEEREKKIVQFVQYSPKQDNQLLQQQYLQKSVQKNQLDFSSSQKPVSNNQFQKQVSQKLQPAHRKIVGKIAKKVLHAKKVQDVIIDLQKHDDKKIVIPMLQETKKTERKIDLSKLSSQITLNSNILSLTIGDLITKDEDEATKLLEQIKELKKKLYSIQAAKHHQDQDQDDSNQNIQQTKGFDTPENHSSPEKNYNSIQQQSVLSNKHNKRQNLGKIYQKIQYNNSRIPEGLQAVGIMTERKGANIMTSQQNKFSARQKYPSTQEFQASKSHNKQKVLPVSFRVRKNSKNFITPYANQQAEGQFTTKLAKDQWLQAKRSSIKKHQIEQEQLKLIQKPVVRQLRFQQNFKEYINNYFIDLGNQELKRNSSQEQLVELAKHTFRKFGFNLQKNKQTTLHVKKYKNCVSFIVDVSRTILWYYQGKFYYGGWVVNGEGQGQKSGWGYDYCPGKFVYSGNFKYNKREGYGIMKFLTKENDTVYEGYWKNGFKNGLGKQKQADQSVSIGFWREGKKHGKGKIISQSQIFDGNYQNGIKNGLGFQKFNNGDTYEGNYFQGKFHGEGIYTWANYSRYKGQFRSGLRNGNGIWNSDFRDPDSDSYQGQYLNDKKNGFGLYKWKDGTTYQGQFLNDLKHGQGVVSYPDGSSTYLEWFQGNIVQQKHQSQRPNSNKCVASDQNSQKIEEQKKQQSKVHLAKINKKNNLKSKIIGGFIDKRN